MMQLFSAARRPSSMHNNRIPSFRQHHRKRRRIQVRHIGVNVLLCLSTQQLVLIFVLVATATSSIVFHCHHKHTERERKKAIDKSALLHKQHWQQQKDVLKNKLHPYSRHLQERALKAAAKAVPHRRSDVFVTTFLQNKHNNNKNHILVFTAPPPFTTNQLPETLQKWVKELSGSSRRRGQLVVFTNDAATRQVCADSDIPTVCLAHTDEGLPRLDQMLRQMQVLASTTIGGVVAFVNSDLHVNNFQAMHQFLTKQLQSTRLPRIRPAAGHYSPFVVHENTQTSDSRWFVVSTRTDVNDDGTRQRHTTGGYDFWAWNTASTIYEQQQSSQLLPFGIPPFRYPYSSYDNWLLDMIILTAHRTAIDASAVPTEWLHYEHKRGQGSAYTDWTHALWSGTTGVYLNRYLAHQPQFFQQQPQAETNTSMSVTATTTRQYMLKHGTPDNCPYYVMDVKEKDATRSDQNNHQWDIAQRDYFGSPVTARDDPSEQERVRNMTRRDAWNFAKLPLVDDDTKEKSKATELATKHWRYTLHEQLRLHARQSDGFVLLTAVNYAYREHLLNFKCILERVGMNDHFVIAALDRKVYKWGIRQGLPMFLTAASAAEATDKTNSTKLAQVGGTYGSEGLKKVTKLKSRATLEVLEAGYSVIWSDVDIMWFVHPFDALAGYMSNQTSVTGNSIMAIQSNSPYKQNDSREGQPHETVSTIQTENPAGRCRLNSGLYVAPHSKIVLAAFRAIVKHAKFSKVTEQPSFDEILCEKFPSERYYSSCIYRPTITPNPETMPTGVEERDAASELHVELLDRFVFPNGAVLVGENNDNAYSLGQDSFSAATKKPLYCAHNNWIVGEDWKKKRAQESGWWFIDQETLICSYPSKTFS